MAQLDCTIFIVTHKQCELPDLPGYSPILVGAVRNEANYIIRDDSGQNISEKNSTFCELTAQYWVWKNVQTDVVGFVHYRRFFYTKHLHKDKRHILSVAEAADDLRRNDIILPEPMCLRRSVSEEYSRYHNPKDLRITREVIAEKSPEFVGAFDQVLASRKFSPYNMFVMRSETFDAYMQWLFSILFEVEARTDVTGYDEYNRRLYGFLSERLLNVWVSKELSKVRHYPVYKDGESVIAIEAKQLIKKTLFR